jgi:hypothetical protein
LTALGYHKRGVNDAGSTWRPLVRVLHHRIPRPAENPARHHEERPPANVTAQLGEPGHRWLVALGSYSGDTATLDIYVAEGGVFDSATPAPTERLDGTITVTFTDCNTGEISYNIPSVSQSGTVPIERIALDNVPFCEEFDNL